MQDCSISSALAMGILQSCTKPSMDSVQDGTDYACAKLSPELKNLEMQHSILKLSVVNWHEPGRKAATTIVVLHSFAHILLRHISINASEIASISTVWPTACSVYMMTSSNVNIFRVTGHLCGEFTGPRWIPYTKASDAELWCLLWSAPE